ncbi:MAG: histidinol dehydrogenase [Planctomycetales bacterium]
MSSKPLSITRIRCDRDDARDALRGLRAKLSPQGDVVSESGRRKTMEVFGEALSPLQVVQRICRDVRDNGLDAVLDYSARIDHAELTMETLRVPLDELDAAYRQADPEFLKVVRRVRDNIHRFQSAILHQDVEIPLEHGGSLGERYRPLSRVGICVPGGAAAYPSTVLMTAVPAQVAGVREIAVVAPPTPFGSYNPDLLATCCELGIIEVYRMGGAQAVAALAHGVEGVPPVQKIVGPGNLFVALAKQQVFGQVDIDSIAGPSEVVVVADGNATAEHLAWDMIAQAEHSPGASVLVTWDEALWKSLPAELDAQLGLADRGDLARQSLEDFGALVLAGDRNEAAEIAEGFAPEHLHLMVDDPEQLLEQIPSAGAVFLGEFSPVAVGDYTAGPSHVLPTSGTARFAAGLSANDFLRPHSVIRFTASDLLASAPNVERMASMEGLPAHWKSVQVRLDAARRAAGETT